MTAKKSTGKKHPAKSLSHKEKSKVVKEAKAGKKMHGGFKKVEEKAAKEYGSKEAGKKVAAAAFWKKIKGGAKLH